MNRFYFPVAMIIWVLGLAFVLIVLIVLRSPDTHSNLGTRPYPDYDRTSLVPISPIGEPTPETFGLKAQIVDSLTIPSAVTVETGRLLFETSGCTRCHGNDGLGGAVGPTTQGFSLRRISRMLRTGPGGMPEYHETLLTDGAIENIAAFIESLGPGPTPTPTPTATPAPTPTPTPTPLPGDPTPEPVPTATPGIDPEIVAAGHTLFIDMACDICHGLQAEGTQKGPSLQGLDLIADGIRDQVRDPQRDPNSTYTREMKPTPVEELRDEELDLIIQYLLSLN